MLVFYHQVRNSWIRRVWHRGPKVVTLMMVSKYRGWNMVDNGSNWIQMLLHICIVPMIIITFTNINQATFHNINQLGINNLCCCKQINSFSTWITATNKNLFQSIKSLTTKKNILLSFRIAYHAVSIIFLTIKKSIRVRGKSSACRVADIFARPLQVEGWVDRWPLFYLYLLIVNAPSCS